MFESCLDKQNTLKKMFAHCKDTQETYTVLLELGKTQKNLADSAKTDDHRVPGCQSRMYLLAEPVEGVMRFSTEADALISAGIGMLLTMIYDGESPETVLKCPPKVLEEIGITASLSPSRSNGLASLYLKMKQAALKELVSS